MCDDDHPDNAIVFVLIRCVACLPVLCLFVVLVLVCLRERELVNEHWLWRLVSCDTACPVCLEKFSSVNDDSTTTTQRDHQNEVQDDCCGREEKSPLLSSATTSDDEASNLQRLTPNTINRIPTPTITFACGHVVCEACWENLILHQQQGQQQGVDDGTASTAVRCPICRAIVFWEEEEEDI
eukprot:scaffold2109_cov188-Amphora_coffeaeformis.AAC.12